jgi:hypothetical protein
MSEYFVVFVTADNCGHCVQTRGGGLLNDGKKLNDASFIKEMLKHNTQYINIHYYNMMAATKSGIKDISKYIKDNDGKIIQEKYYNFKSETRLEVFKESGSSSTRIYNDFVNKDKEKIKWLKLIDDKIPNKILNYVFYFPGFILLRKKDWNTCLKDGSKELMGLTNAGFTVINEKGVIGILKDGQSLGQREVEILSMIDDVINGKIPFEPHIDKTKDIKDIKDIDIKDIIGKPKQVKFTNQTFLEYKDVVIRGFDD